MPAGAGAGQRGGPIRVAALNGLLVVEVLFWNVPLVDDAHEVRLQPAQDRDCGVDQ